MRKSKDLSLLASLWNCFIKDLPEEPSGCVVGSSIRAEVWDATVMINAVDSLIFKDEKFEI